MALSDLSNVQYRSLQPRSQAIGAELISQARGTIDIGFLSIDTIHRQPHVRKDLRHSNQYSFPKLLVEHISCFERSNNQSSIELGEVSQPYMPKLAYEGVDFLWVAGVFATTSAFRTDTCG